jgi:hypothetical protein
MGFEVYTKMPTPFAFGGTHVFIKTDIEEYQRIDIGASYFGILFQNPITKSWHIALEDCGALIGTQKSRTKLISTVKKDVSTGTPKIFEQQIVMGKKQMSQAKFMERDEWFSKFSGR